MEPFVEFITRLIYATGAEAVITPNHRNWLSANPTPSGTAWISHFLDRLLPAYEAWLAGNHLPPIVPWNGENTRPWDSGNEYPLAGSPLATPLTLPSLEALGQAFQARFDEITNTTLDRLELQGVEKDPFSYRFWGYLKFADNIRRQYQGEIVIPAATLYDRDGTILSPIPFCNVFNTLHGVWHGVNNPTGTNSALTPGLQSSAGQFTSAGGIGLTSGEEFIMFHHDHVGLFSRWLARTGQPPVKPINMYNGNSGWPGSPGTNPSTWVETVETTWINDSNGDTDNELFALTSLSALGDLMRNTIHGAGHGANSDIADINHNNFVPRFHAWHGWIDAQWYWRKPRFGFYDNAAKQRVRTFAPVLFSGGGDWPGMTALTIVRDPLAAADVVEPAGALNGLNLTTGAGSLRLKLHVEDPYDRQLRLRLTAEVFDDAAATVVETIPSTSHTYLIGSTAAGDDFNRDADFTVDFAFSTAFRSDDPARANPSVGFVANRIRITGTLEAADGSDPNFTETDHVDIFLLKEKAAPDIDLYFDLDTFGEDMVTSAQSLTASGDAVFSNALYVTVQDRTTDANPIDWSVHPDVAPEVQGLLTGFIPAAGLFGDAAHAPQITLGNTQGGAPLTGVRFELANGPLLEDATLADNRPQRFTYVYNAVFEASNNAFAGLATGAQQPITVTVTGYDRAGNQAAANDTITLARHANPFMRDGSTSWLSIDTRVFHILEGDTIFGETVTATTDPNSFIKTILGKLDSGTGLGGDSFDGLPTNQAESALLPFPTLTDQTTGASRRVLNFALAKVRLQGAGGAANVRAFFRLFRYSASNLVFEPGTHYRTHDAGAGVKVPVLGYEGLTGGSELVSIPFFAEPRVAAGSPMTGQTDPANAKSFPGSATEDVLYFGAYLDINDASVRFPLNLITGRPDGGFSASDPTQPLPTLMLDRHQCMVVEINYDGDVTTTGDTPANSDNLAQRNLMILTTDNPGAPLTHTVQHSFEIDLGRRREQRDLEQGLTDVMGLEMRPRLVSPTVRRLNFISQSRWNTLVREKAIGRAMNTRGVPMTAWRQFVPEIERELERKNPLRFSHERWGNTTDWIDELLINWGDIPAAATATIYLPGISCAHVLNLRNLRHAPGDVKIVDSHTLALTPAGVTYLPLPALGTDRLAGLITIVLPEGIKKGQGWQVDVVQLRGGQRQVMGGFQIDIQVKTAAEIHADETLFLAHNFAALSLLDKGNRWHPVLSKRVETMRQRARDLADAAGVDWIDPTAYPDPDAPGGYRPYRGKKVTVVLEKIQILDDLDTFFKGKGELVFQTRVVSANNGVQVEAHRLPEKGVFKVSDKPGKNMITFDQAIFSGYVEDDLRIEIAGFEQDLLDPDDTLGKYSRILCGSADEFFGAYAPGEAPVDPQNMISWKVWYRVERG